ncbi:MAG: NAD(P)/FAD-dependent oxidoreductase, partial [Candidatus Limnocylindrales bacterium]
AGPSVLLVDPRPPLSLTSNRPEANYRNWWPQAPMVELAERSIDLLEALVDRGPGFAMNRRGYLYVTADPALAQGLPEVVARYRDAGLGPDAAELILAPAVIHDRFPHLGPSVCGAIHVRRAGSVDTLGLGRSMLDEAVARGVRVVRGEIRDIDRDANGIRAVRVTTANGSERLEVTAFLDAAGPFASQVARLAGVDLPMETILRQKVLLHDPLGVVPRSAPFTIGLDPFEGQPAGVHIKPDDSGAGDAIKLGWAVDQEPAVPVARPACPPAFPRLVLARAASLVPGLAAYLEGELDLIDHDGGFYARTPDGLPLIGRLQPEGMFVLAGLAGFGAMMASGAGELAAAWLLGDEPSELAAAFLPSRFGVGTMTRAPRSAPPGEL